MWWEDLKRDLRDMLRAVVREELDARDKLRSSSEMATYLEWSLDKWQAAVKRDADLAKLAVPRGGDYGWPLAEVLDHLRATGKKRGKAS